MQQLVKIVTSDLFVLAGGKLLQMLLLLLAVRLFTTYLSDVEIGNLILILAVTTFFGLALINPVGSYLNRELNRWLNSGQLLQKLVRFNVYVFLVSLIAFVLPYLLAWGGIGLSIDTLLFSIVVSLFVFFNTWNQTLIPALNLLFHRKTFVVLTLLSVSLYLAFSLLFVLNFEATAFWWLIGQASGLLLGILLAIGYFYFSDIDCGHLAKPLWNTDGWRTVAKFAMPLAVATLFLWVLSHVYKLIIEGQFGAESLAYIGLALALATSLAGSIESLVMQVYHSPFYKGLEQAQTAEQRQRVFQEFINQTVPIISGALFVLLSLSSFLLTILAESRFAVVYQFLMLAFVIEYFRVITNIVSHAAHSEYQTKQNIVPYFVGALLASVLVMIAVFQSNWEYWVIASLILAWLLACLLMVRSAQNLLAFNFPYLESLRVVATLSPVPLLAWWLHQYAGDIIHAIGFVTLAGLYSAIIIYRQYQRTHHAG